MYVTANESPIMIIEKDVKFTIQTSLPRTQKSISFKLDAISLPLTLFSLHP